jgi:hypothetical protein
MPSVLVIVCASMLGWRMPSEMVNSVVRPSERSAAHLLPDLRTSSADSVCTGRSMSLIDSGSRREADSAAIGCWLDCPAPIASVRASSVYALSVDAARRPAADDPALR